MCAKCKSQLLIVFDCLFALIIVLHHICQITLGAIHLVQMQCNHNIHFCQSFEILWSLLLFTIKQMIRNALIMQPIVIRYTKTLLLFSLAIIYKFIHFMNFRLSGLINCFWPGWFMCGFHEISNKPTQRQKHMYELKITQWMNE